MSMGQLVADLHDCLIEQELVAHNDGPAIASANHRIVLFGQSVGARVAMGYAAAFPHVVTHLGLGDMDIEPRRVHMPIPSAVLSASDGASESWVREHATETEARAQLATLPYASKLQDRVHCTTDGRYLITYDPRAAHEIHRKILCTDEGETAFERLRRDMPVSLFMADGSNGDDACVTRSSLAHMTHVQPQLHVVCFPRSGHQIYKTNLEEFVNELHTIVDSLQSTCDVKLSGAGSNSSNEAAASVSVSGLSCD
jgi:pimeloyl-ACP methyl ester carboxylesterase